MRTTKRAALALAMAAAMTPFAVTAAHAGGTTPTYSQRDPGTCPRSYLCVYKDINYGSGNVGIAKFQYDNTIWSDTVNAYMAHQDSSWFDNGTGTSYSSVVVYADNGYGGNSFCLDAGWGNTWDAVANDQGESNKWIKGTC
ncbi:peptidase inhibitor family I36 protein [Streptomyces sp. NPDC057950]|uniref:peptidase inhibitor family I36 protein n=1 Tax=Streptomyces sp. NPDC057950 TaxID=3346288 RepID=UPI0036E08966